MAINFSQPVRANVAGSQPEGVADMQLGGVAGTKSVISTGAIGAMPPLQDCGDSD